ncbi:MAG: thiolase C-terminal domain-containing protein [Phototrophicaceae bacterium]
MRDVAIVGVGQTPVNEYWDRGLRSLSGEAIGLAMADANMESVDALYVGNGYGASVSSQAHIGALIADFAGLAGIEAFSFEAGDASGAAALRSGYLAVASGLVDSVLVLGVEKLTDTVAAERVRARNVSIDADYETIHGASITALAAMLMRRYMHEYGLDLSAFEGFSLNAHHNGSLNPNAMYRNRLKAGAFAKAPMISDPVSLFDSAPDADGAAAVILTSTERALDRVAKPIQIVGSAAATDIFALHDRKDPLFLAAVALSTQKAFQQADLTPDAVDLFELHDAYTILAALSLEAAGYAERGTGWQLATNGGEAIALTGKLPLSTWGGLKSRGNPAGATGVYQAVEATLQLRGEAGANQVANAQVALIQNLGGLASTAITHLLQVI